MASETRVVRPLIKWAGGKYEEYATFSAYIPDFDRYFEPFFGGGGVFFALRPKKNSLINDRSEDLIAFYRALQRPGFKKELLNLVSTWESLQTFYRPFNDYIIDKFHNFLTDKDDQSTLFAYIETYFQTTGLEIAVNAGSFSVIDEEVLRVYLNKSIKDKFKRIKNLTRKVGKLFRTHELKNHIETAIRSGFYYYMRHLMNEGKRNLPIDAYTAVWYFVREFCYASMFRFNAQGKFNIPYGGIAYNKKNLRAKVSTLFSDDVKDIFKNCQIFNLDFEEFLNVTMPAARDFIFLDPPYDSEFSEYDQNAFTREDQIRLRDALYQQPAKWMLVIKETSFIRNIYTEINANFIDFDKTYLYNVKGRNNRNTKHLIITNYTL